MANILRPQKINEKKIKTNKSFIYFCSKALAILFTISVSLFFLSTFYATILNLSFLVEFLFTTGFPLKAVMMTPIVQSFNLLSPFSFLYLLSPTFVANLTPLVSMKILLSSVILPSMIYLARKELFFHRGAYIANFLGITPDDKEHILGESYFIGLMARLFQFTNYVAHYLSLCTIPLVSSRKMSLDEKEIRTLSSFEVIYLYMAFSFNIKAVNSPNHCRVEKIHEGLYFIVPDSEDTRLYENAPKNSMDTHMDICLSKTRSIAYRLDEVNPTPYYFCKDSIELNEPFLMPAFYRKGNSIFDTKSLPTVDAIPLLANKIFAHHISSRPSEYFSVEEQINIGSTGTFAYRQISKVSLWSYTPHIPYDDKLILYTGKKGVGVRALIDNKAQKAQFLPYFCASTSTPSSYDTSDIHQFNADFIISKHGFEANKKVINRLRFFHPDRFNCEVDSSISTAIELVRGNLTATTKNFLLFTQVQRPLEVALQAPMSPTSKIMFSSILDPNLERMDFWRHYEQLTPNEQSLFMKDFANALKNNKITKVEAYRG